MMKTHARRQEVVEGMSTEDLLKQYPFLRTSAGVSKDIILAKMKDLELWQIHIGQYIVPLEIFS